MTKLRSFILLTALGGAGAIGAAATAQTAGQNNNNQAFFGGSLFGNSSSGIQGPGTRQTARFLSDVEFNDNYDLRPDSLGNALIWTNTLAYGLERRTRTDEFLFDAQGSVRASDLPLIGTDVLADDPRIRLAFNRQIDDNRINFAVRYQRADLDYFDPLSDLDIDGSFDDTISGGTRESIRSNFGLSLNQQGPVSLNLTGILSQVNYYDTVDPDLNDTDRATLRAGLGFSLSPILRLTTDASYDRQKQEDASDPDRTTRRADIGFDALLNQRVMARARIGYSEVEVNRSSGTTTDSGLVGSLGVVVTEKTGQTRADISSRRDENGLRTDATIGKTLVWTNGQLDADLGVSTNEFTDLRPVGRLQYTYDLPRSRITAALRQATTADSAGNDVVNTGVNLGYRQLINNVSSLDFGVSGGLQRFENSNRQATQRLNLTAQYNHAITRDWSMNAGYRYRHRDSSSQPESHSNAIFVGVSRSWDSIR
ncbi:MAG: hypothetical protein KDA50_13700 [Rhodobacteraceae bacterium]|nr:hypothetical protein [Paracoccaceae bacterium]